MELTDTMSQFMMDTFPDKNIPTRALVVDKPGAPFILRDVILDEVRADELLIQIKFTGICHTDLVVQAGGIPVGSYPAVLGHEGAGIVRRLGSNVLETSPDLHVGDLVLLSFCSCMSCSACHQGRKGACPHMTEINFAGARGADSSPIRLLDGSPVRGQFFGQSSFSELAVVNVRSVIKYNGAVVEDLSFLAPLGCGYQTGAGTVLDVLKPRANSSLAIFGLGAVGLSALMAAKSRNVKEIIAVDILDAKLEIARSLGATCTINAESEDISVAIRSTLPLGVDAIVDTTGLTSMINTGISILSHEGTFVMVGVPKPGESLHIEALEFLLSCKNLVGVIEGACDPQKLIPRLIRLFQDGLFPIDKLSKIYNVSELFHAVEDMKSGKVVKSVLAW